MSEILFKDSKWQVGWAKPWREMSQSERDAVIAKQEAYQEWEREYDKKVLQASLAESQPTHDRIDA